MFSAPAGDEQFKADPQLEISKEMLFLLPAIDPGRRDALPPPAWMPAILRSNWRHFIHQHHVAQRACSDPCSGRWSADLSSGSSASWARSVSDAWRWGLGDVHLMFGVGAIIGAGGATIAFFIAPFFAILTTLYRLVFHKGREIPLGPYLSMATAAVMLLYCGVVERYAPGFQGLLLMLSDQLHHG